MQETKKYKELERQDKKAFANFVKHLTGGQLLLFKKFLIARHLFEQERINSIFEK